MEGHATRRSSALRRDTIVPFIDEQVQQVIDNVFVALRSVCSARPPSPMGTRHRSPGSTHPPRLRSSSYHRQRPLHRPMARCSLPSTENDFIHHPTPSAGSRRHDLHRMSSVQYSFSLYDQSWSRKRPPSRSCSTGIQQYIDGLVEDCIQNALHRVNNDSLSLSFHRLLIDGISLDLSTETPSHRFIRRPIGSIDHRSVHCTAILYPSEREYRLRCSFNVGRQESVLALG